jgi:hypothetical protein
MRISNPREKHLSHSNCSSVLFASTTNDEILTSQVKQEHVNFGDIIQFSFYESYRNLTLKTLMGFKWATVVVPIRKACLTCPVLLYEGVSHVSPIIFLTNKFEGTVNIKITLTTLMGLSGQLNL